MGGGCKLFKLLKMRNLKDINDIFNAQDVYTLDVITEYRWQKIKEDTGFDPRCFTSASTLSGAIERVKSKIVITYPKDIETVELMEELLSGGYSLVHTRVGFDTEMFTPKSKEYLAQKDNIVDDLRNVYDDPDEKSQRQVLMQNLIDLWKNEDRNNPHKVIFNLRLEGEEQSQPRRVFSKIFKLNENNQYRCSMNKPLPIGVFKKKPLVDLDI